MNPVNAELATERLTLRAWRVEDAPALRAALDASDAHLRPWVPFMAHEPRSLEGTRDQVRRFAEDHRVGACFRWAVREGEVLVGEVLLMPKDDAPVAIGYWLHVDHGGRGLAREAVARVVEHADEQGIDELEAFIDPANAASIRLVEKLGFTWDREVVLGADTLGVWRRG